MPRASSRQTEPVEHRELRTVGVEEELLLVDAETGEPLAVAGSVLAGSDGLEAELQQQQIEIGTPPCRTLDDLGAQIRRWRSVAARHAEGVGARIVASGTCPLPVVPRLTIKPRYRVMVESFGLTTAEQLTCGCHVHVGVESDEEGVAVLDRIRVWLPVLLALSANSPYWQGTDSGYESFRSQVWCRLPTAGPTEVFGSAERYHADVDRLLGSGIVLDPGMVYFDARLSHHLPTVEVRVADVCVDPEDTLLVAGLVRALVETAARSWAAGQPAPAVPASILRLASWRAGRSGLTGDLLDPIVGVPPPAARVVAALLEHVDGVLRECGDHQQVTEAVARLADSGTGSVHQRRGAEQNENLGAMVLRMADLTTS